jgi:hypothetical protein
MKKKILAFTLILLIITSTFLFAYSETYTISTTYDLENTILSSLYNRNTDISINYTGELNGLENVLNSIIYKDEYLKYTIGNWKWSYKGYEGNIDINIEASHLISRTEEDMSNIKIDEILNSIISDNMTVHEKIKVAHDYVVLNVAYDQTLTYRTQYDALFRNTTVCHGYALLFYRMMEELNIPVRLVIGSAGSAHIWNMVQVDNAWYHIDTTFDDPVPDRLNQVSYKYYMLTEEEISKDHVIEEENIPNTSETYELLLNDLVENSGNTVYINLLNSLGYNYINTTPNIEDDKDTHTASSAINILAIDDYVKYDRSYGFPFIDENSRTQVPFRITLENLGANVSWDEENRTAIAELNNIKVNIPIGESYILVNGKKVQNDTNSLIKDGRTYLPIRKVMESFGYTVGWDGLTQTVLISE